MTVTMGPGTLYIQRVDDIFNSTVKLARPPRSTQVLPPRPAPVQSWLIDTHYESKPCPKDCNFSQEMCLCGCKSYFCKDHNASFYWSDEDHMLKWMFGRVNRLISDVQWFDVHEDSYAFATDVLE